MKTANIRDSLVLWLSKTQAASRELSPEQHRAYCEKLGITEELLREAHMLRAKQDFQQYKTSGRHGDYVARKVAQQSGTHSVVAHCSKALKKHIETYCATRHVDHTTFARSLIHHYLRGTWEPEHLTGLWTIRSFEGNQHPVKEANIHAAVTEGAKEALRRRATAIGASPVKVMRALVSAGVNEDFGQPGTIRFVAKGQMFSSIDRYELPD